MTNMTREEVKEMLPVLQAFSDGKTIESRCIKGDKSLWYDDEDQSFDNDLEYRIKPDAKYRPFKNAEECWQEMLKHHPFGWVVGRRDGVMYLIRSLEYVSVYTSIQYSFKDAFDTFEFADLVPFGVKEEE